MTSQHDKAKRWRLRFSVRTLVVVVTLACWGPTKKWGVNDVSNGAASATRLSIEPDYLFGVRNNAVAPLFVVTEEPEIAESSPSLIVLTGNRVKRVYFWFFGYVAKLPYERDLKN
jgi:hypothetical protein